MRFPGFSDEWKRIPLNQLVDRVTRKNKGEESKIALTISAQYGLVDQESFFNNKVASADLSHYYLLYNGEYAYNKSYSANYPWGAAKRLNLYDKGAVSTLYICFRPKAFVDSDYIGHYFESSKWHKGVSEIAVEGARNHGLLNIGVKDYFETTHFIPSLPEQKKIAALLNLIDERIATQTKIIDSLQSLIKGLAKAHYDSCKTLRQVKIRELGEPYSVMNLSKEQLSEYGQPCILYGELFTQYGAVIDSIFSKTSIEKNLSISCGRDLLFPSSTTVDALSLIAPSALTQPNIILGGDMFGIKVANDYSPEYLSYYFNYIGNHELAKYAIGSTIIHLHYKDIAVHTIAIPALTDQLSFVKLASAMRSKIETEKSLLRNLNTLKVYLLQAMFI